MLPLLFALLLATVQASAAEIHTLDVRRANGRVFIDSRMHIAASQRVVFAALSDYDNLASLSSRFRESRSSVDATGATQVYTLIEGCVWFFCRSVERHAMLETEPPLSIVATVDPERSDFAYGLEQWRLTEDEAGTHVHYTHELEPRFWVPPLIGVWVIRRTLADDALKAATRIEAKAHSDGAAQRE